MEPNVRLNRSGMAAVAVYAIASALLIVLRLLGKWTSLVDFGQDILVGLPLLSMGLSLLSEMRFMEKYALFLFPLRLGVVYVAGCGIGRLMGLDAVVNAGPSDEPREEGAAGRDEPG
jgi:hypothetical protein